MQVCDALASVAGVAAHLGRFLPRLGPFPWAAPSFAAWTGAAARV